MLYSCETCANNDQIYAESCVACEQRGEDRPTNYIQIPTILDSGERREFATGAVRDMSSSGKGRCDLMPLEVISNLMDSDFLSEISNYRKTNRTVHLYNALRIFIRDNYATMEDAMLALSLHFENGAKKYGENNWQLGLPESCYIDSAIRHSLKHGRGDKDEPHNAATMWNLVCLIWEHDHHNKNGGAED